MSAPRINAATANLMLNYGIGDRANGGKLQIFDGVQPSVGGGALGSHTKLLEFTFDADAFPPATGGIITANSIGAVSGIANGTASWFRMIQSNGNHLLDGDVGLTGSGADCIISALEISPLDVFALLSLVIEQPLQ